MARSPGCTRCAAAPLMPSTPLPRAPGITYVEVATAADLQAACEEGFDACDVLVMAAAVVDFRPARVHEGKMKKTTDQADLEDVFLEFYRSGTQ